MKRFALVLLLAASAFAQNQNFNGSGGGAATPGGASGSIQYNNASALGGIASSSYSSTTGTLNFTGNLPLSTNGLTLNPINTNSACDLFGDSITAGSGAPYVTEDYANLLSYNISCAPTNNGVVGDQSVDTMTNKIYPTVSTTNYNPIYTVMIGTNDAGNMGLGANPQAIYTNMMQSMMAWIEVPNSAKTLATNANCTATGTWTADNTIVSGYALKSSTNGDTLSCTGVQVNNGVLYVWLWWIDTDAGTATVRVDGGASIGTINGFGPQALSTVNGTTRAPAMYRFTGVANGTHTILITVSSATGASNVVSVVGMGTPQVPVAGMTLPPASPRMYVANVLHQQNGNLDATTLVYSNLAQAAVTTMQGDGLQVFGVDVRDAVSPTTQFLNQLHPNLSGHHAIADVFTASIQPSNLGNQLGQTISATPLIKQDSSANSGTNTTMSTLWYATKVTPTFTGTISDFVVQLEQSGSITNGTTLLSSFIYTDDGGSPSKPSVLSATCNSLAYNNLTLSYINFSFYCSTLPTITSGTPVWLVLKQLVAPTGANIVTNTSAAGTNLAATSPDGVTWTNVNTPQWNLLRGTTNNSFAVSSINSFALNVTGSGQTALNVFNNTGKGVVSTSHDNNAFSGTSTNSTAGSFTSTAGVGASGASSTTAGILGTSTSNVGGSFSGGTGAGGGDVLAQHGQYKGTESATAPTGAAAVDFLFANSADHVWGMNVNNGGLLNLMQRFTTNSTYTNATTTFSNVTTLAFPVTASRNYTATCYIMWQGSAATTGPKYQWTGPASPTAVVASMWSNVTTSTYTTATATAFSSAMANAGTVTLTTNFMDVLNISVINGVNAGTVQLQAAANGTGTLTVQNGSYCLVQ